MDHHQSYSVRNSGQLSFLYIVFTHDYRLHREWTADCESAIIAVRTVTCDVTWYRKGVKQLPPEHQGYRFDTIVTIRRSTSFMVTQLCKTLTWNKTTPLFSFISCRLECLVHSLCKNGGKESAKYPPINFSCPHNDKLFISLSRKLSYTCVVSIIWQSLSSSIRVLP